MLPDREYLVSVVIPAYNCAHFIAETIESVAQQTVREQIQEVIIVNDGSLDNTQQKIFDLKELYAPQLNIICINQENFGPSAARNAGISYARSPWIALLDADDSWLPHKLETQLDALKRHPDIKFLASTCEGQPASWGTLIYPGIRSLTMKQLLIKTCMSTPTWLFNKQWLGELAYFNTAQNHAEDQRFLLLAAQKIKLYYLEEPLVQLCDKNPYGDNGLSADLAQLHRGCLNNIIQLRKNNSITSSAFFLFTLWEIIRHSRRVLICKLRPPASEPQKTNVASLRILYGVTVGISAEAFLEGQLGYMAKAGNQVAFTCDPSPGILALAAQENVDYLPLAIARDPSLLQDIQSLIRMIKIVKNFQPDVCVYGTPKMSLVGALASAFCRVPRRIYHFLGMRHEGLAGISKYLYIAVEKIVCTLSTDIVPISSSVEEKIAELRLAPGKKVHLLGHGSVNGVNLAKFAPPTPEQRLIARHQFSVDPETPVVIFAGRLTKEKGLATLVTATSDPRLATVQFLIAGRPEPQCSDDTRALEILATQQNVSLLGHCDVGPLFKAADLLILPTHREGMGNVLIEAGAMSIPVVAYDVTGVTSVVDHEENGLLVPFEDRQAFADAIVTLVKNPDLATRLGSRGHAMVTQRFAQEKVWEKWKIFLAGNRTGYVE